LDWERGAPEGYAGVELAGKNRYNSDMGKKRGNLSLLLASGGAEKRVFQLSIDFST